MILLDNAVFRVRTYRVCSLCFYLTPYYLDIAFKVLHNATRRQIQTKLRQWRKNVQRAIHFAPYFDSSQSRGLKRGSGKKSTFSYFDENGEKLKKLDIKFLVLTRDK